MLEYFVIRDAQSRALARHLLMAQVEPFLLALAIARPADVTAIGDDAARARIVGSIDKALAIGCESGDAAFVFTELAFEWGDDFLELPWAKTALAREGKPDEKARFLAAASAAALERRFVEERALEKKRFAARTGRLDATRSG